MMENLFVAIMASAGSHDEQTLGRVKGITPWLKVFRLLNKTLYAASRKISHSWISARCCHNWDRPKVNSRHSPVRDRMHRFETLLGSLPAGCAKSSPPHTVYMVAAPDT